MGLGIPSEHPARFLSVRTLCRDVVARQIRCWLGRVVLHGRFVVRWGSGLAEDSELQCPLGGGVSGGILAMMWPGDPSVVPVVKYSAFGNMSIGDGVLQRISKTSLDVFIVVDVIVLLVVLLWRFTSKIAKEIV